MSWRRGDDDYIFSKIVLNIPEKRHATHVVLISHKYMRITNYSFITFKPKITKSGNIIIPKAARVTMVNIVFYYSYVK